MDREQIARDVRRRQAEDTLAFERDREKTLHEQIELVIAETEGPRLDAEVFARMSPEDVEIVKADFAPPPVSYEAGSGFGPLERDDVIFLDDEDDAEDEELTRLNEELEECRSRQRAFQAYLDALGG